MFVLTYRNEHENLRDKTFSNHVEAERWANRNNFEIIDIEQVQNINDRKFPNPFEKPRNLNNNYTAMNNNGKYGNRSNGNYRGNSNGYQSRPANNEPPKKSGAKYGISPKTGKPYVQGWKASRGVITKLIASPKMDGDKMVHAKGKTNGQEYQVFVCSVQVGIEKPVLYTGFYNHSTGKLRIPDINHVASTKTRRGGYFGLSVRSKYN